MRGRLILCRIRQLDTPPLSKHLRCKSRNFDLNVHIGILRCYTTFNNQLRTAPSNGSVHAPCFLCWNPSSGKGPPFFYLWVNDAPFYLEKKIGSRLNLEFYPKIRKCAAFWHWDKLPCTYVFAAETEMPMDPSTIIALAALVSDWLTHWLTPV